MKRGSFLALLAGASAAVALTFKASAVARPIAMDTIDAGTMALTPESLQQARILMATALDARGLPILVEPTHLVTRDNETLLAAQEILGSMWAPRLTKDEETGEWLDNRANVYQPRIDAMLDPGVFTGPLEKKTWVLRGEMGYPNDAPPYVVAL